MTAERIATRSEPSGRSASGAAAPLPRPVSTGAARASRAPAADEQDRVFESAAELFGLLATPVRLKIISAVCQGERNVTELLALIDTTQPNMSQHLATLWRAGVLGRRREGTQIYYRLLSERVATLCRAVCTQVAVELDSAGDLPDDQRLLPGAAR